MKKFKTLKEAKKYLREKYPHNSTSVRLYDFGEKRKLRYGVGTHIQWLSL